MNKKFKVSNCTLINLNAEDNTTELMYGIHAFRFKGSIENCYLFYYNPNTKLYYMGMNTINTNAGTTGTFENITPNYDSYQLLSNDNYGYFFGEDNVLKDDVESTTFIAVENITSPVVINKQVNLTAVRGHTGYSKVSLVEGSDKSVIEDSIIGELELNEAYEVKVTNNKINGNITVVSSEDNVIENNIINTTGEYTIVLGEDAVNNVIRDNVLIAGKYTGDKSVSSIGDNTVEGNTPEYIVPPELVVDSTEFTSGSNATISAGIYLEDVIDSSVSGGKVIFKVNGKTLRNVDGSVVYASLVDGVASITYVVPASWNNNATIVAVYSGTSAFESLRSQAQAITVNKKIPTLTTTDVSANKEDTLVLEANIKVDEEDLNTGRVIFKVNGKTVKDVNTNQTYVNVTNGVATISYKVAANLKSKDYTIKVIYTSVEYDRLEDIKTLTVN